MPTFINEVTLPLTTSGVWETVDLSPYIPVTAAVALLRLRNVYGWSYTLLARSYESTDVVASQIGNNGAIRDGGLIPQACKVGSSRRISVFRYSGTTSNFVSLYGYLTTEEAYADDNMSHFIANTAAEWNTMSLTSMIPPAAGKVWGVLLNPVNNVGTFSVYGIRGTGQSYENLSYYNQALCGMYAVKLTGASNTIDVQSSLPSSLKFYVAAWIKKDIITMHPTAVNVTPASTGAWLDVSTLPAKATAGIYDVTSIGRQVYGIASKNFAWSENNVSGNTELHTGVGCIPPAPSGNQIISAFKNSAGITIYELGYWKKEESNQLFMGTHY